MVFWVVYLSLPVSTRFTYIPLRGDAKRDELGPSKVSNPNDCMKPSTSGFCLIGTSLIEHENTGGPTLVLTYPEGGIAEVTA